MIETEQSTARAKVHQSPYRAYGGKQNLALEKIAANPAHRVVQHVGHIESWRAYIDFDNVFPSIPISGELQFLPTAHLSDLAVEAHGHHNLIQHIHDGLNQVTDQFLLVAISNLIETTPFDTVSDKLRVMAEGSEFLESLYKEKNVADPEDVVFLVVQNVFRWLSLKAFRTLDFVMSSAQVKELSTEIIVALLRTSSQKSSFLTSWNRFLAGARLELNARGEDAEKILFGL
jgi:hypothetical protein